MDSLLLIEEKRDGKIKGCKVAPRDQQKRFHSKEEVHSPTVNTASVMLTAVIEAKEGRDTRVHDVTNAFCQAYNDEKVIMKIKGKAAEYLILADPRLYRRYVRLENGVTVLYVELKRLYMGSLKLHFCSIRSLLKTFKALVLYLTHMTPV